jgi:IS1 family transposase
MGTSTTVSNASNAKPVGKETGLTNDVERVERLNNTLRQRMRQRISRLVLRTLSFSKSWVNHEAAIWRFIHHYNASLPMAS